MSQGGDPEGLSAAREKDDDNIRWLLAAVLHHEPDAMPPVSDEEE